MLSVDEEHKRIALSLPSPPATATPESKRRKRQATMGKELTAAQKELVKVFVTREVAEGPVKCNYCDKEITSRNVDRWASHLRGCVKTPADIKAQIQPHRDGEEAPPAPTSAAGRSVLPAARSDVQAAVPVVAPATHVPLRPTPWATAITKCSRCTCPRTT